MPKPHCHGITKSGKRCRNFALPNDAYCAVHRKVPPPPDVWGRIRAGISTAADVAKIIGGSQAVYHAIEFVLKHHPHFTGQLSTANDDYLRLARLVGDDLSDDTPQAIESDTLDWAVAYRLYVMARQIAEEQSPVESSNQTMFEDFDEWFATLNEVQQAAAADALEEPGYEMMTDEL